MIIADIFSHSDSLKLPETFMEWKIACEPNVIHVLTISLWLPSSVMQATWNLLLELPNPSSAPDFRIHYRVQNPTLAEHEA